MPPEGVPIREALPLLDQEPASPGLKQHIALGNFNASGQIDTKVPTEVHPDAFIALHNQNIAKRQADAEKFAEKNPDLPAGELRHEQMKVWGLHIWAEMSHLLDTKQEKVFEIFANPQKLGIPVNPNGNPGQELLKQFYDPEIQKEGAFYQKFCTGNMNEKLANSLTVDDMMHLRGFLTKWMLGSDEAFNALVALRQTMDTVGSQEASEREQMTQHANTPLSERDDKILAYFREGLALGNLNKQQPIESGLEEIVFSPTLVGASESQGKRAEMEDASVIETHLGGNEKREFYAIYDGHGDKAVATEASVVLHQFLRQALDAGKTPVEALTLAYQQTQERLQTENVPGGATAITVFMEGEKIVIGNLGDARAIVVHGNGEAERLSYDRKAIDPAEQKAVEARGGIIAQGRVVGKDGLLAVSAALGDTDYPGIQTDPDIKEIKRDKNDKWLILACDGIWDVIKDQEIPSIIGQETDPQKASERIMKEAAQRGSTDNLSVIAVELASLIRIQTEHDTQQVDERNAQKVESPGIVEENERIKALISPIIAHYTRPTTLPPQQLYRINGQPGEAPLPTPQELSIVQQFLSGARKRLEADPQVMQFRAFFTTLPKDFQAVGNFSGKAYQPDESVQQPLFSRNAQGEPMIRMSPSLYRLLQISGDIEVQQARLQSYAPTNTQQPNPYFGNDAEYFSNSLERILELYS